VSPALESRQAVSPAWGIRATHSITLPVKWPASLPAQATW